MMKKLFMILGSTLLVAVAMVTFVSASNNDAKASLLRQNVEAVAGGENPMQDKAWEVTEYPTHIHCVPGGTDKCE